MNKIRFETAALLFCTGWTAACSVNLLFLPDTEWIQMCAGVGMFGTTIFGTFCALGVWRGHCYHKTYGEYPPNSLADLYAQEFTVKTALDRLAWHYMQAHSRAGMEGCFSTASRLTKHQRKLNKEKEQKKKVFLRAFYAARYFGYVLPDRPENVRDCHRITPPQAKAA